MAKKNHTVFPVVSDSSEEIKKLFQNLLYLSDAYEAVYFLSQESDSSRAVEVLPALNLQFSSILREAELLRLTY